MNNYGDAWWLTVPQSGPISLCLINWVLLLCEFYRNQRRWALHVVGVRPTGRLLFSSCSKETERKHLHFQKWAVLCVETPWVAEGVVKSCRVFVIIDVSCHQI